MLPSLYCFQLVKVTSTPAVQIDGLLLPLGSGLSILIPKTKEEGNVIGVASIVEIVSEVKMVPVLVEC